MGGSPCCGRVLSMEDWGAVKARLEKWLSTRTEFIRIEPIAADIRAALERVADLEDQVDYWMGKELALRLRVEELERQQGTIDALAAAKGE